ncbi:MAG: zinc ribbon domain-containing protein [Clostridia bacterium]|nr:zinc ribbon domain-containing protein [Clostridia bacterium]
MFKNLADEIKALNSDVKNAANGERAKKLRKKLLSVGLPIAIIGFVGVFTCIVLFTTAGFDAFGEHGFTARVLVPFFLIIPFAVVGGFGSTIASLGFKIVIVGYTSDLIDETVGNNYPNCGDNISQDEIFCSNCGYQLKKECPDCKTINSHKDKFCKKCGKEL